MFNLRKTGCKFKRIKFSSHFVTLYTRKDQFATLYIFYSKLAVSELQVCWLENDYVARDYIIVIYLTTFLYECTLKYRFTY